MEGLESAYQRKEKHMKSSVECKHCKSTAHSSLEHRKHYKSFREEKKSERMEKHMKMFEHETSEEPAKKYRKDDSDEMEYKHEKKFPNVGGIRHSGKTDGKSNALGHGGRAQQLKDRGVPGAVIGMLARRAHAAPGQANYHGKHRKGVADQPSLQGFNPSARTSAPNSTFTGVGNLPKTAAPNMRANILNNPRTGTQYEVNGQGGGAGSQSGSTRMNTAALGGANTTQIKSKHRKQFDDKSSDMSMKHRKIGDETNKQTRENTEMQYKRPNNLGKFLHKKKVD